MIQKILNEIKNRELLAFHSAVYDKAYMEKIPLDAVYRITEDIPTLTSLN